MPAISLAPVIFPAFVNVELASPNIPVEWAVPNFISPLVSFVPVDAFKAIPTNPSFEVEGTAVFVSIVPALLTVEPTLPNIPVEPFPFNVILAFWILVASEPITAIPTTLSLFPVILPLFVITDFFVPSFSPNIPVENAVPRVISPPVSFVPVEAFKAIPTNPSVEDVGCVAGATIFVSIVPTLLTVEPFLPKIPVEPFPSNTIDFPALFVALEPSTAIPTVEPFTPLIVPLFTTFDLVVPLASPNIPFEFAPFNVIVALFVALEPFAAIPTALSAVPVIFPAFVNVELFSPNIPVE